MNIENEYRLSLYQNLGKTDGNEKIELVRNRINGLIGVRKVVSGGRASVYSYLQKHPSPYIPAIYEIIEDNEKLIVIEEYIPGNTVEDILRERRMDEREAAMFALELCNALKVLHHAEPMIVCRDLKAENVMIDNNGQVKIVDFDIARTVHEGQGRDTVLMGTAEYAAPEQYGYFQTDNRSDIFSLGILLNYTMTGKFPVEKTVNGKMRAVIRKCICMEPLERYQSVEELESEIRNIFMIGEDENEKNESSAKGVVRLTIPGFRTGKVWKMIVAVLGYTFIGCLTLTMEFESEGVKLYGAKLWVERIILFAAMIFFLFLAAGYRGWNREIPIVRSENIWIRTAGLVGAFVLLFIGVVFVFVVVETIV